MLTLIMCWTEVDPPSYREPRTIHLYGEIVREKRVQYSYKNPWGEVATIISQVSFEDARFQCWMETTHWRNEFEERYCL